MPAGLIEIRRVPQSNEERRYCPKSFCMDTVTGPGRIGMRHCNSALLPLAHTGPIVWHLAIDAMALGF